jgi:hypothetical protein
MDEPVFFIFLFIVWNLIYFLLLNQNGARDDDDYSWSMIIFLTWSNNKTTLLL